MIHGGDVYTDGLRKGRELIDYSSNINPLGVPSSFIDNISQAIDALTRYPDIKYRDVLKVLREYVGCPEEYFVLGNGAAEIIDLVISCHKSLLIVVPSFVEYEIDAKKWNCHIEYSYLKERINEKDSLKQDYAELSYDYEDIINKLKSVEAMILGNPNNPNGGIIDKEEFQKILEYCESNNKVIIIDEAFIEFTGDEQHSFVGSLKNYKCLFIIRALTKFFAMPGIRFGYGISSNSDLIKSIKEKQNPWNINCFAEVAACHVLKDSEYIEKSKQWISGERPRFLNSLKNISFIEEVYFTYGNYVLCKINGLTSEELYKLCLAQGFVIRKADNFRGLNNQYIRLAIKDRDTNEKLILAMKETPGGHLGMKSIVIASNTSGGGKTTVTLGIMKALKNRGLDVQGYKVGPDYLDTAFHTKITGKNSRNLDLFLMGEAGVKASFSRGVGDVAVVEGVMGLYDGKGIDTSNSTYHISKVLDLPIILVLSPKAQVATFCAEINGIINFKDANIKGIILNNITESYYNLLKAAIKENCNVEVLGYLPKDERLNLKSRHLGLIQSSEVEDLEEKIEICAQLLEKHVDMDLLLQKFKETEKYVDNFHLENRGKRIAVAYDKAFSFYYKENLELLEELGEVIYFSPIEDKKLPSNIDFLYIGGGYPEVFIKELSQNTSMLESIKTALNNGLHCYAECGGLMYLTQGEKPQGEEGISHKAVGFFNGDYTLTKTLQNFGYSEIKVGVENNILPKDMSINCHEFHKSNVNLEEEKIFNLFKQVYDGNQKKWQCGYIKKNTLAAYGHVHFFGNLQWALEIFK